jgi:hypothetical protein
MWPFGENNKNDPKSSSSIQPAGEDNRKNAKSSSSVQPIMEIASFVEENGIKSESKFDGTIAAAPVAVATALPNNGWTSVPSSVVSDPTNTNSNDANQEREKVLVGIYQISRFIRIVTVIDLAFIIVFALFSPIFCVLLPFPICGYWGAKKWIYRLLFVYSMYLILEIVGGIISAIYIKNTAFIVVRVIYIVFNIVIARYSTKLCSYILVFEPEDLEFVKHSATVQAIEKSLLC